MRALVDQLPDPGRYILEGDEAHHLLKVKRIRVNEEVEFLDGKGGRAFCHVEHTEKKKIHLQVNSVKREKPPEEFGLALAIPCQLSTLNTMLPGLVQVGITRLFLCETEFSGPLKKVQPQLRRFHNILSQSLKQCGRAWIPTLELTTFNTLVDEKEDHVFSDWHIYHPGGSTWECERHHLKKPLLILIGPEGGFSEKEVKQAASVGATILGLGAAILKMETAAIGVCFRANQYQNEVSRG